MKPLIKNNTLILFFSIFFSYVFVFEVPWSNIVYFVDIDFYLERIGVLLLSGIEEMLQKIIQELVCYQVNYYGI